MINESTALTIGTAICIGLFNETLLQVAGNPLPNAENWRGWFVAGMTGLVALITAYYHNRRNDLRLQVVELAERQKQTAQKVKALRIAEGRLTEQPIALKEDRRQIKQVEKRVQDDRDQIARLTKENAELRATCDQLRSEIVSLRKSIAKIKSLDPDAP